MKQTLRKTFALKALMLVAMLVGGFNGAWAEEATFAPSDFSGQGVSGSGGAISATVSGVTFACDKGFGTTEIRCYSGSKITISSSNTITAISFTFASGRNGGLETSYTGLSTTSWEQTLSSQARFSSITVTYTANGGTGTELDDCDLTLGQTSLTFDLYDDADAQTISYTTSSTGAVTVEENAYIEAVVNANNTITVTPKKKTNGEVEITVNQAADDNYKAGTAKFTVNISDSKPVGNITEETITISDLGYAQGAELGEISGDAVTITWDKGTNTNSPKAYNNGAEARFYKGNTMTFSATKNIVQIEFTYSSGYSGANLTSDCGSVDDGVWTGSATEVTLTNGASDNTQIRFTAITITYEGGTVIVKPALTATSNTLEYNATSGSISYTLSNPVEGGSLTATTTADWLIIGTVGETIPFTCNANEAGADRTATVTLTYTYNTDQTVTKDVTVIQAGNPDAVMTIAEARAQATGSVATKGVVTSCVGTTAYIQDATAAICVYGTALTVGDEVKVSGTLSNYNGLLEITSPTIVVLSQNNIVAPQTMTIAEINASTNQGWLVKIEDAIVTAIDGQNTTIAQDENTIVVRGISSNVGHAVNDIITLTGNIGCYNVAQIANPTVVRLTHPEADKFTVTWTNTEDIEFYVFDVNDQNTALQPGVELAAGTKVMISPDVLKENYVLDVLSVKDADDNAVALAGPQGGAWTFTLPSSNVTISATIKEKATPTGDAFVKVASTADIEDGDYLIVYEEGKVAFNGGGEALDAVNNTIAVEIEDETIANIEDNTAAIFKIATIDGGYSIQAANGQYIGRSANSNGLDATETASVNTITIDDEGNAVITSESGCTLRFNSASNQNRFRYYTSGQKAIQLYKLGGQKDERPVPSIKFVSGTEELGATLQMALNETKAISISTNLESLEDISIASSNSDVVKYEESALVALAEGTAIITASFGGNESFKPAKVTLEVTVADTRRDVALSFENVPSTINIDETATYAVTATAENLAITYSSSDASIVEVNENGVISAKAVGTATITAAFAGNDTYKPAEASYTITVKDPNVQTTYYALVADLGNGLGMALNNVAGSSNNSLAGVKVGIVNGKVIGETDNISWEVTSGDEFKVINKENGQYLAHSTVTGSARTNLSLTSYSNGVDNWGTVWSATERGAIGSYNGRSQAIQWYTSSDCFKNYAGDGSDAYKAVDKYEFAEGYSRVVADGAWGTICLPNNVAATDYVGAKFYTVFGKVLDAQGNPTKIGLQEVTGALEAGKPYIFNASSTMVAAAYGRVTADAAGNDGVLFGSFEGEDVAEGMYLLSGGEVVKCGTGCTIGANRAYIDLSNAEVKQESDLEGLVKFFVGDSADAINAINAAQNGAVMYDLAGRRVNASKAGLYIVNGKKVAVK